jgi:hypothetical protein
MGPVSDCTGILAVTVLWCGLVLLLIGRWLLDKIIEHSKFKNPDYQKQNGRWVRIHDSKGRQ